MKKIYILAIILILFISFFLRFYKLTSFPASLSLDEVGIGYNAYSILKTGKDEWGAKLPIVFRAVDDYKPPTDIYLTAISVFFFGLTEFAVRFPIALIGAISPLIFIFILRQLKFSKLISLVGGLWLAVSPWSIVYSHANYEATLALFLLLLGVYFLIKWLSNAKPYLLAISTAALALSAWSYHAERFFVPIFVLILLIAFRKNFIQFSKHIKNIRLPIMVLLLFIIPFIYLSFFTPAIRTRPLSTSILRESSLVLGLHNGIYKTVQEKIFNNDTYIVFRHWAGKYLNYFDLRFWFWKGLGLTPPGYPDIGLFYLIDTPIILFGIYKLFVSKNKTLKIIALTWFFVGPLPASLAVNEQHALRSLVWLPFFGFAFAAGFEAISKVFRYAYIILLPISILYFLNLYTVQYPTFFSEFWQYGYKQISLFACANKDKYNEIIITDTFGSDAPINTGIPYAYVLFYCKYDPAKFLADNRHIDKFSFRRPDWPNDSTRKNTLLIGSIWDFPEKGIPESNILQKVYFLNGKLGFIIAKSNGK